MSSPEPDWLRNHKAMRAAIASGAAPALPDPKGRASDGTFLPGTSGHPGRVSPNKRTLIAKHLEEGDDKAIIQAVVNKAKLGDVAAAALVLARLAPPARPESAKTPFALDTTQPLAAQAAAVVQAVANGELSAEEGDIVMRCLASYVTLRSADELQTRVCQLERALGLSAGNGSGVVTVPIEQYEPSNKRLLSQ